MPDYIYEPPVSSHRRMYAIYVYVYMLMCIYEYAVEILGVYGFDLKTDMHDRLANSRCT